MPDNISAEEVKALPSHFKMNARKKGEFGPPVFDEVWTRYNFRHFKRGFSWGVILVSPIFFQFALFTNYLKPATFSRSQLFVYPVFIGCIVGSCFGAMEILGNPQRRYETPVILMPSKNDEKPI